MSTKMIVVYHDKEQIAHRGYGLGHLHDIAFYCVKKDIQDQLGAH